MYSYSIYIESSERQYVALSAIHTDMYSKCTYHMYEDMYVSMYLGWLVAGTNVL